MAASISPAQGQGSGQQNATADSGQSLGDVARAAREKNRQPQISAADQRELFADMDDIFDFASKDTGLAKKGKIDREFIGRDDLEKRMRKMVSDDDDAGRFARQEVSLKKFGYLPRDFDLNNFMVALLGESVAGFYDPREKKMFLLNWVPPNQQKPTMAHELTHALQDQNFDLQVWLKPKKVKTEKVELAGNDTSWSESGEDETGAARHAVIEGQAMIVYMDYILTSRSAGTLENNPDAIEPMKETMADADNTPLMRRAPLLLRESLTFPYQAGVSFEIALLQQGSRKLAFNGVLMQPPHNTHEILHPKAYMTKEPVPVVSLPDIRTRIGDESEVYDRGQIGELDVRIFLQQFFDKKAALKISEQWQGGAYLTVKRKSVTHPGTADVSLLCATRWKSHEAADRFARLYQEAVAKRYKTATSASATPSCSGQESCPQFFADVSTEEGDVIIQRWANDLVVVTETFDRQMATKLADAVYQENMKQAAATSASAFSTDLSLRFAASPLAMLAQDVLREQMIESLCDRINADTSKSNP